MPTLTELERTATLLDFAEVVERSVHHAHHGVRAERAGVVVTTSSLSDES